MSSYIVKFTSQFKKDYRLAKKRGKDMILLDNIIRKLTAGE